MGKKTGPMPEHRKEHLRKLRKAKKEGKPVLEETPSPFLDVVKTPWHVDMPYTVTFRTHSGEDYEKN